ncbi:MAG: SpoIIE family protein phosphatase [Planctomycetes bacterium]|nr:SpoIIE family protein phosphatase [Planctomycetota bacterium]
MTEKPICLTPDRPIQEALDLMNKLRVGAVLIVADDRLVGIFTERDFLRRAAGASPGWRTTELGEWMSPNPYTIEPDAGWDQALTSLERLRVRHLPVVENGKVIGIVSARQLISRRAEYLKTTVDARTVELKRAIEQLMVRDQEMSHYMKSAARLQRKSVLPHSPPAWPEISLGVHYAPLDPLGGDYYDFAQPDDEHLGILIADASGHGIPAAMVAIMARFAFVEIASRTRSPSEVLASLNNRLQDLTDERFVTAFYGVFNRRTRKLTYANAGHPFPFHWSARENRLQPLSARGFLLGISPEEIYREQCLQLTPGDRLCFFTDGIPDSRNDLGESYGTDRLGESLPALPDHEEASAWAGTMIRDVADFRAGQRPIDDMTLIMAKVM